jgi:hypothetical protein
MGDDATVAGVGGSGRFSGRRLRWAAAPAVAVLLVGCAAAPSSQAPGGGRPSGSSVPGSSVPGSSVPGSSASGSDQPHDGQGLAGPPSGGDPQAALATWRSFPVGTTPRPLVLTAGGILDPETGFVTGDQKLAYIDGRFTLATVLPTAPSTFGGYPIVAAKAALDQLRHAPGTSGGSTAQPLRIVGATLGKAAFGTDRGPQLLPAWRFVLEGVAGAVQVLAVTPNTLWPPTPQPLGSRERASIAADGQSVTYSFWGTPPGPGPCGADYAGTVAESRTAAVIRVQDVTVRPSGGGSTDQACTAVAALRTVTVHLAAPLGARVLLTAQGTPISVTSR